MLNLTKKPISVYIGVFVLIILFVFIILDMQEFYQQKCKEYKKAVMKTPILNTVEIQDLYVQMSKYVSESNKEYIQRTIKTDEADIDISNPWRIKIPKLKLDAPIAEGTSSEVLETTVGHFEETDKWNGNVALAGHNRGYSCNFFQDIKKLKKGDLIIYCTEKGNRKYKVVVNTIIKETDWSYIQNTKDNRITLITCEANQRENRRCIQAVEVKDKL